MCLILFAYNCHPNYRLILAANRDEYYRRSSLPVAYWSEFPDLLAGRDLEAGGTWLGITRQGRFAALTNYRDPALHNKEALSRGQLVSGYLTGTDSPEDYLAQVKEERDRYNPFNILVGNREKLYYYSPLKNRIEEVEPGVHGLSNGFLDTPWPKVIKGKKSLTNILKQQELDARELLKLLTDKEIFEDHRLPDTGVGMDWERVLSPIYIESPDYGTRASTILLLNHNNHVVMFEKSLKEERLEYNEVYHELDFVD